MPEFPCPRCGKTITDIGSLRHYYVCNEAIGGCGEVFAKDEGCFFHGIYMLNPQGEVVAYIDGDAVGAKELWRKVTRTDGFIPDKRGYR